MFYTTVYVYQKNMLFKKAKIIILYLYIVMFTSKLQPDLVYKTCFTNTSHTFRQLLQLYITK